MLKLHSRYYLLFYFILLFYLLFISLKSSWLIAKGYPRYTEKTLYRNHFLPVKPIEGTIKQAGFQNSAVLREKMELYNSVRTETKSYNNIYYKLWKHLKRIRNTFKDSKKHMPGKYITNCRTSMVDHVPDTLLSQWLFAAK